MLKRSLILSFLIFILIANIASAAQSLDSINFNSTPSDIESLLGEPISIKSDNGEPPMVYYNYSGVKVWFSQNKLAYLNINAPGMSYLGIEVGDNISKVINKYGQSTVKNGRHIYIINNNSNQRLIFSTENEVITAITLTRLTVSY